MKLGFVLALAIGGAGGFVAALAHLPLAWMLGALVACTIAALLGAPVESPVWARPPVVTVIGLMLGASFSPAMFEGIGNWVLTVAGLFAYLFIGGLACVFYLRRAAGYDNGTAFFAGMPGGLSDMVVLGEHHGADVRIIALIHSIRVLLVVLILPLIIMAIGHANLPPRPTFNFDLHWPAESVAHAGATALIGIAIGHLLRLPAKFMFGPMIASAIAHLSGLSDFTLPTLLVNLAQIVLGVTIGCRFRNAPPHIFKRVFLHAAVVTIILLAITAAFAIFLSAYTDIGMLQIILAYAPGGLTEMGLIAVALHLDAAFVVAHHLLRIFAVILIAQLLGASWAGRRRQDLSGD